MTPPSSGRRVRWISSAKSLHMALSIGVGGLVFVVGNLSLAGTLPSEGFGRLALFQAILGLGGGLGPLGLDSLVVRRELRVGAAALGNSLVAGTLTAAAALTVAGVAYGFETAALLMLGLGVIAATVARMCAASQQALVRLGRAQLLTQLPMVSFGVAAPVLALADVADWRAGGLLLALSYLGAALLGILMLDGKTASPDPPVPRSMSRRLATRAFALVGIHASVLLLHHLERLVVGGFLSLEDLAVYAVVATVVASPYRTLHGGIGYALMPRLRAEHDLSRRRRLTRNELRLAAFLGFGGGICLALLARPLIQALYGDKYPVGLGLVIAIVLVGIVRVFYGVAATVVSALGESSRLRAFNGLGWLSTGVALVAAVGLSAYGLIGVVMGVGAGWAARLLVATALARPVLADPVRAD